MDISSLGPEQFIAASQSQPRAIPTGVIRFQMAGVPSIQPQFSVRQSGSGYSLQIFDQPPIELEWSGSNWSGARDTQAENGRRRLRVEVEPRADGGLTVRTARGHVNFRGDFFVVKQATFQSM